MSAGAQRRVRGGLEAGDGIHRGSALRCRVLDLRIVGLPARQQRAAPGLAAVARPENAEPGIRGDLAVGVGVVEPGQANEPVVIAGGQTGLRIARAARHRSFVLPLDCDVAEDLERAARDPRPGCTPGPPPMLAFGPATIWAAASLAKMPMRRQRQREPDVAPASKGSTASRSQSASRPSETALSTIDDGTALRSAIHGEPPRDATGVAAARSTR